MMIFIAEIGLNHNGNLDLGYELIKQAKYSGADIVKFQLGWRGEKGEINHISFSDLIRIKEWCDYFEIELMFSIFTEKAFVQAKKLKLNRYKIASRTLLNNFDLAEQIINEGKETIISLGMWEKKILPFTNSRHIKYLWCKSKYPTFPKDLVGFPKSFKKNHIIGYSDHSIGIENTLIAISRGANIIEKHFTLDKSDNSIRDHILSATPSEFKIMIEIGRTIHKNIKIGL